MIRTGDPKGILNRDAPPEGKNSSPWEYLDLGEPMLYETSGIITTDRQWINGFLVLTDMRLIFIEPTFSTWLVPLELDLLEIEYMYPVSSWLPTQVAGISLPSVFDFPSPSPTLAIELTDGHRETVQLPERDIWISRIALARLHKSRRPEFTDRPEGDRP